MQPPQAKLLSEDPLDRALDPRAYLEQFTVDNTCELCGETLLAYIVYEEGKPERRVPRVKRVWMRGIFKRDGYKLKHSRWWKLCETCRLKLSGEDDLAGFAKFAFPVIRAMATQPNLINDLIPVQPMNAPNAGVFYMDYVYTRRTRVVEEPRPRRWLRRSGPHDDLRDAVAGALLAYQHERVRGKQAEGIVLDDANWRLDPDPDSIRVEGDQILVDVAVTPPKTPDRIEINFKVDKDGAVFDANPGEPND